MTYKEQTKIYNLQDRVIITSNRPTQQPYTVTVVGRWRTATWYGYAVEADGGAIFNIDFERIICMAPALPSTEIDIYED